MLSTAPLCVSRSPSLRTLFRISGQGTSGFTLYNTHSLPVPREEHKLLLPAIAVLGQFRYPVTVVATFKINYKHVSLSLDFQNGDIGLATSTWTRPVLKNPIGDRAIIPRHPLQRPWDAPFFYEDRLHVFYVNTAQRLVRVPKWGRYAPTLISQIDEIAIPTLVQTKLPRDPRPGPIGDLYGPMVDGAGFGVVDPSLMERFVSEGCLYQPGDWHYRDGTLRRQRDRTGGRPDKRHTEGIKRRTNHG